jgi:hypothetical protein
MSKSKNVVVLNENNHFVGLKKTFFDNRANTFSMIPNGYDIPLPDEKEGYFSIWNFEKEEWYYEKEISEEKDQLEEQVQNILQRDPMYYLKLVRNNLLLETDSIVLKYYQESKEVPESIKKYREELRDIPSKIESGVLKKPTYVESVEKLIAEVVKPELLINFKWPEKPDLGVK